MLSEMCQLLHQLKSNQVEKFGIASFGTVSLAERTTPCCEWPFVLLGWSRCFISRCDFVWRFRVLHMESKKRCTTMQTDWRMKGKRETKKHPSNSSKNSRHHPSLIEEIGRLASKSVQIFNLNRFQAGTDRPVAITILWTGNLNQLN